ncbi:IS701 family transposase [Fluviispira sanaruensis]|uniref:IS701 family transposase n=1 Tax=Fluviispira sanaruensis TaxID=2493639 RepID=A0A4P2VW88_FLUSA|nr:IS701 family transposase [Fluviispira sanaruensis]BBH53212.1 IS701 family transposase [Fluviispira sanaruensis]
MKIANIKDLSLKVSQFIDGFRSVFKRNDRVHWCKTYIYGLILDGERKSIGAMASRISNANEQSLQQFVNQSQWSFHELIISLNKYMINRLKMNEFIFSLDDTSLPKKGDESVGVSRQYCGVQGKISNCQVIVTLHAISNKIYFPVTARLYLPDGWIKNSKKLDKVKVPLEERNFKEKWRIALDLIDESIQLFKIKSLVFDAAYGCNRNFLNELDKRKINFVGHIRNNEKFWSKNIPIKSVVPRKRNLQTKLRDYDNPVDNRYKPRSALRIAEELFSKGSNIKIIQIRRKNENIKVEYVATRVMECISRPWQKVGKERWLLVEKRKDGVLKYYISNYSKTYPKDEIIELMHKRWKIEQGYQILKEELGLDHYEGRSWLGLHHHIALCFLAYYFINEFDKKKLEISFSAVRRYINRIFQTIFCPFCDNTFPCFPKLILNTS